MVSFLIGFFLTLIASFLVNGEIPLGDGEPGPGPRPIYDEPGPRPIPESVDLDEPVGLGALNGCCSR